MASASNARKDQEARAPRNAPNGKVRSILDSGSVPTVANVTKFFTGATIRPSNAQAGGVKYINASGGGMPNLGEADITHYQPDGTRFDFTFQHADVHYPILSVNQLVNVGCRVTFRKKGGVITYADGRRLPFTCKKGVFFVLLDIDGPVFSRQAP